jgi:hypothetical protein
MSALAPNQYPTGSAKHHMLSLIVSDERGQSFYHTQWNAAMSELSETR